MMMFAIHRGGRDDRRQPPAGPPAIPRDQLEELARRIEDTVAGTCSKAEAHALIAFLWALRGPHDGRAFRFNSAAEHCLRTLPAADLAQVAANFMHAASLSTGRPQDRDTDDARAARVSLMADALLLMPDEAQRNLTDLATAITVPADSRTRRIRTAMHRLMCSSFDADDLAYIIGAAVKILRRQTDAPTNP